MQPKKIYLIITTALPIHDVLIPKLHAALGQCPNITTTTGAVPHRSCRVPFGMSPVQFMVSEHISREMTVVNKTGIRSENEVVFAPYVDSSPHADTVHLAVCGDAHTGKSTIMSAIEHTLRKESGHTFQVASVKHVSLDIGTGPFSEAKTKEIFDQLPPVEVIILCQRPKGNTRLNAVLARTPEAIGA